MIIPGQHSLPPSVRNQFVTTFTNTDVQTRTSPRETPLTHHNRQGFRIPDLRRHPSGNPTFHSAPSFLGPPQHNRHLSTVLFLPALLPWIATMFGVFLHCTAVLNCARATHGIPADRAPVYRGCPCRDPLGCPLIPRQDGIRDKAPLRVITERAATNTERKKKRQKKKNDRKKKTEKKTTKTNDKKNGRKKMVEKKGKKKKGRKKMAGKK